MATATQNSPGTDSQFMLDVDTGLSAERKFLPPKYFYDAIGDRLFRQIMALPEYYVTRTEHGILTHYREQLLKHFAEDGPFTLVELGAGDGMKTKILLRHFSGSKARFKYAPVDISGNALARLVSTVSAEFPMLDMAPFRGDYFAALQAIRKDRTRKAVLFLGASIGNFDFKEALAFVQDLRQSLSSGDVVLIGFDLRKNPHEILSAYNDAAGVTRDFNLNLLTRINRELGGNFDLGNFIHYPTYDPGSGEAKSYLVSVVKQSVTIEKLNKTFHFDEGETIHTEISRKYTPAEINLLAELSGFEQIENFSDPKNRFVDVLWKC